MAELHVCDVCCQTSDQHPEQCPSPDHPPHPVWPAMCCQGCACLSYEEAHLGDVRAITVKQPWAWAIAAGHKLVENRSRGTSYRGTLLIHAGKGWSDRGGQDSRVVYASGFSAGLWRTRGAVVAVAQLVDSHPDADCCHPWGESSYTEGDGRLRTNVHHLVLEDVRALPVPTYARGALGLWKPSLDLAVHALSAAGTGRG